LTFEQVSRIPNVWNDWIIYPAIAWVLFLAAGALLVFRNKPISETEIKREIDRQAGPVADIRQLCGLARRAGGPAGLACPGAGPA